MELIFQREKSAERCFAANPNAPYRQWLSALHVQNLKSLSNFQDLRFAKEGLTAILGPNGCGKSTVLHSLACCYQPLIGKSRPDYKFSDFFVPTSDVTWQGSSFCIDIEHEGPRHEVGYRFTYAKKKDRWAPRYDRRPARDLVFVGIRTCVPRIEDETLTSRIPYTTQALTGGNYQKVRDAAAYVLNFDYTEFNEHSVAGKRRYIGVKNRDVRYSSLSMGAGEQRVFEIFTQAYSLGHYGLMLIDEVDLLLHADALDRLLSRLSDLALDRHLQIIFTTHREMVVESPHVQAVRHLYAVSGQTLVLDRTTPDAIRRLTGRASAPIEVFVEDDVAEAVVRRVALGLGAKRNVNILKVGSGDNGFSALSGLLLRGQSIAAVLFVLDGDTHRTAESRVKRANQVLTGNHPCDVRRRESLLSAVASLNAPDGLCPEQVLRNLIAEQGRPASVEAAEIWDIAQSIVVVDDRHHFVNKIVEVLGMDRASALAQIVTVASEADGWGSYVEPVRDWIEARVSQLC